MNPLFRPDEDALGGLLAGMTPQDAGNLPAPGLNAVGGLLAGLGEALPGRGSLRRAWEGSDLRQGVQNALDTASYYAGPHLSNRAEAVAAVAPMLTPQFGTVDARAAGEAFGQGKYGRGAGLLGLGVAGGLLDALPGEAAVKGLLKGLHGAAHYAPDLGMAVAPALSASHRLPGYVDPPAQRIADWQWRPLSDVARELNLTEVPSHVQEFGNFMRQQAERAGSEGLTPRDLIKAYTTTRASIQRRAANADTIRALGLDIPAGEAKVRPEGAFAEWLQTPQGQTYLNAAERGTVDAGAVADAQRVMKPFGKTDTDLPQALSWAAQNLPGREGAASDLIARGLDKTSDRPEWRQFTSDVYGIGPSKSGFFASLLGRGDAPTLDARQVILHTGQPTKEASRYVARGGGQGGAEAVDRLAARQDALGLPIPDELSPFYQHLAHHAVWDKAGNEVTTHADVIRAMRLAGLGALGLGVPAAMAAQQQFQPER